MAKGQNAQKSTKTVSTKSLKEKRAEKKAKKASKEDFFSIHISISFIFDSFRFLSLIAVRRLEYKSYEGITLKSENPYLNFLSLKILNF